MTLNVVSLHDSNFRDPAATLRRIADEIDAGEYGDVETIGLVLRGETIEVFGLGPDSEGPTTALLLHEGFRRLSDWCIGD